MMDYTCEVHKDITDSCFFVIQSKKNHEPIAAYCVSCVLEKSGAKNHAKVASPNEEGR